MASSKLNKRKNKNREKAKYVSHKSNKRIFKRYDDIKYSSKRFVPDTLSIQNENKIDQKIKEFEQNKKMKKTIAKR